MGTADMTQADTLTTDNTMLEIPKIDVTTLDNIKHFVLTYHEQEDTLFMRPNEARPATSFDCNGEFWLRVAPETGEIVGVEVNDFEAVFLKKHPELAKAWKEVKPVSRRFYSVQKRRRSKDVASEPFSRIISDFLIRFFRDNPCQVSFSH